MVVCNPPSQWMALKPPFIYIIYNPCFVGIKPFLSLLKIGVDVDLVNLQAPNHHPLALAGDHDLQKCEAGGASLTSF